MNGKNAKQSHAQQKRADIVFIGGGPATLGVLCNAFKTNRLPDLVATGEGIAILEQGMGFGGGDLVSYGINSNTSANGFMKQCYKKREITETSPKKTASRSPVKKTPSKVENKAMPMEGTEESSESELAEDSERDEDKVEDTTKKFEYVAVQPFKDLYKCTPLHNFMSSFGISIVPLSVVGAFLNYTGNHLLHHIY